MFKASSTFETSADFYQTARRNNPEDSHLNNVDVGHIFNFFL
jgi:hypothetical protein